APQHEGNLNCPLAVTTSASIFALRVLADPDVPPCAGAYRPLEVIAPEGTFRNSEREEVFLGPFTIPFGGNGLAIVNLEARIPLSSSIRAVPFYDGGNVFRKAGDIFKAPTVSENDVPAQNQRAVWTHTLGLGFRIKTPIGGEFGIDYGRLLNPPVFLIPQVSGPNARYRLRQDHIHFRFSQAF
ncbi:MAG: hydantoinase B/oxoprolinase family protein, partial [Pyrinomonadaceae bacterium]